MNLNPKTFVKKAIMRAGAMFGAGCGSKILYYHDVFRTVNYRALDADFCMGTPLELFRSHVDTIRRSGYDIVTHITSTDSQVAIMFDDGFRGIWECRDYFRAEGICPTVFLPSDYVGRTDLGIMSADEILELQDLGFRFECHGRSHRPLTAMSDAELRDELGSSRSSLSAVLDRDVTGICMPLGYFNSRVLKEIRRAGFAEIYSCIPGDVNYKPYGLLTRNLCQFADSDEVRLILRGGNELLKKHYLKLHYRQ